MGWKDIQAGSYVAKAKKGQFSVSAQKNTPGVAVLFEMLMPNGAKEMLWWTGWLTEAAFPHTMKALAIAGYDETKGYNPDGSIPEENFDSNVECSVTVEIEDYIDKNGQPKQTPKITFVNQPGGSKFQALEPQAVKQMLAGIDLRRAMVAAKKELGIKTGTPQAQSKPQLPNFAPGAHSTPPQQQVARPPGAPPVTQQHGMVPPNAATNPNFPPMPPEFTADGEEIPF